MKLFRAGRVAIVTSNLVLQLTFSKVTTNSGVVRVRLLIRAGAARASANNLNLVIIA